MSRNVIIYDNELKLAAVETQNYCYELSNLVNRYLTSLQYVTEHAIHDNLVTNELNGLMDKVRGVQAPLEEVAEQIKETVESFISEIDDADQFLY